jgi:hypothetical protein
MEGTPAPANFVFSIPPEMQTGRYANVLGVWHTPHEFTLDFSVMVQVVPPSEPDGVAQVPCEVVARIKVAPSLIFDLLRALNENMTRYEQTYGEIRRPGEGTDAPDSP